MKLTKALNIEQPFASQICTGDLKILVKPHYFFSDDRIAVYATSDNLEVDASLPVSMIVGSVRVADCVKVDSDRTAQMIAELTSPEYAEKFPRKLIPFPKPIYKNHYIWVMEDFFLFNDPVELTADDKISALWTDIDIEDQFGAEDRLFGGEDGEAEGEDGDDDDEGESPMMAIEEFTVDSSAHHI